MRPEALNSIVAIGVPPDHFFPQGATLEIGEFGALVVGRNGAGKTRLLSAIAESLDLIFDIRANRARWGATFGGIVTPSDRDQPWEPASDESGRIHDPRVLFNQAVDSLSNLQWLGSSGAHVDPVRERAISTLRGVSRSEVEVVATIFAALNFLDSEAHWPHYPYLLSACVEIAREFSLGVAQPGASHDVRLRLWYNARPDSTPTLLTVLAALEAYEGTAIEIIDGRIRRSKETTTLTSEDLSRLAHTPATQLKRRRVVGPFEFCTPSLPLPGVCLGDGVLRCDDQSPLPFEGRRVERVLDTRGSSTMSGPILNTSYRVIRFGEARTGGLAAPSAADGDDLSTSPDLDGDLMSHEAATDDETLSPWSAVERWPSEPSTHPHRVTLRGDQHEYRFPELVWAHAAAVSQVADAVFRRLLPEPPALELVDDGGCLSWRARVAQDVVLPLEALSFANLRWARFSIRLAERFLDRLVPLVGSPEFEEWATDWLQPHECGVSEGMPGTLVVIDEPEAGLHRAAEAPLAKGLAELAEISGFKPVIATHSPSFIRNFVASGANVFWVHQTSAGERTIDQFTATDILTMGEAIGADAADLLQLIRGFLIVEGEHDKAVFNALFGDELHRLGVLVIPMRGVRGISQVIDSNLLWNFTDAHLFVLLDHLASTTVEEIWAQSLGWWRQAEEEEAQAVLEGLNSLQGSGQAEIKAVRELLGHALESSSPERLNVLGLRAKDILNYFHPKEVVVLGGDSIAEEPDRDRAWRKLEARWRKAGSQPSFKSWLCLEYPGTEISPRILENAIRQWDSIPSDLSGVIAKVKDRLLDR